jgi:chromatin remodeling complex protein RSC6
MFKIFRYIHGNKIKNNDTKVKPTKETVIMQNIYVFFNKLLQDIFPTRTTIMPNGQLKVSLEFLSNFNPFEGMNTSHV